MKALTLHQPWASLIAGGRKTIETRPWAPPCGLVGERFAIHAGTGRSRSRSRLMMPDGGPVTWGAATGKGTVTGVPGQVVGPYHYLPQFLQSSRGVFVCSGDPPSGSRAPKNSKHIQCVTAW